MRKSSFSHPFIILFVFFLIGCSDSRPNESKNQLPVSNTSLLFFKKSEKMEDAMKGKDIRAISNIMDLDDPSYKEKPILILYYTSYDCSSCVHKGFDFIQETKIVANNIAMPILAGKKSNFSAPHFEYSGKILEDTSSLLHHELGYFPTPVLIRYSIQKGIEKMYFIPTFEDSIYVDQFRNYITLN